MLPPERLKPHLAHQDRFVRKAVADYFGDSFSQDPEIVPLILQACERYGDEQNLNGLCACEKLAFTAEAIRGLLQRLARASNGDAIFHYNAAILAAPFELLKLHQVDIRTNPNFDPDLAPQLERRLKFVEWSSERLWQALQD